MIQVHEIYKEKVQPVRLHQDCLIRTRNNI